MPLARRHVDPASLQPAGLHSASQSFRGKAVVKSEGPSPTAASRRKPVAPPVPETIGSVIRSTAATSKVLTPTNADGRARSDDGSRLGRKPAPATVAAAKGHLRGTGVSIVTPRSARLPRFVGGRAVVTPPACLVKLRAKGLLESADPPPPPPAKARAPPPFATHDDAAHPAAAAAAAAAAPPRALRRRVTPEAGAASVPDGVVLHKESRRKFCKPTSPRNMFRMSPRLSARVAGNTNKRQAPDTSHVLVPKPAEVKPPNIFQQQVMDRCKTENRNPITHTAAVNAAVERRRGVRLLPQSNRTATTMAVGAQRSSHVASACPFDVSYHKSPFAPPTARTTRPSNKRLGGFAPAHSERPF